MASSLHVLIAHRSQDYPIPGEPQQIQSERISPVASVASQTWRRSDSIAPWTQRGIQGVASLPATTWFMIKMIYKVDETGNGTLDQTPVFIQEAAAREEDIIVKIVHRHGVMKGGQGAEVEIQDRGIMVGTGNNSRPSVFGVVAI